MYMDNIRDWTKQPTARLLRMAEDWQCWRIMVAKASTVSPQRVSCLWCWCQPLSVYVLPVALSSLRVELCLTVWSGQAHKADMFTRKVRRICYLIIFKLLESRAGYDIMVLMHTSGALMLLLKIVISTSRLVKLLVIINGNNQEWTVRAA